MNKTLSGKVINSLGWAFGSTISIRVAQLLAMIVLARLLTPAQFGLFALSSMIITAITLFTNYGFGEFLLYLKSDLKRHSDTAFVMSLAFGLFAWTAIFFSAPLAIKVFGTAALIWPLRIMSLSIILSSTALVPGALLERELEFRKRAVPEIAMGATHVVVAITLAFLGYGVWSLVLGYLISTAVATVWTWKLANWRPSISFNLESAKMVFSFGKPLMASSLMLLGFFYIDQASVGKWLGVAAVGCYNMAFTICHLPVTNITFVVNRVMYPAYSKLNDDISSVRKAYAQAVRSISVISIPIALSLFLMANDLVTGFFGHKWLPAVPLIRVLAFYGMFRSIATTADSVFMATGKTKWAFRVSLAQIAVALPLVYPVAMKYGTIGVAGLFTLAYSVGGAIGLYKVTHLIKLPSKQFVSLFQLPLLISVVVVSLSFGISRLFHPGLAAALSGIISTLTLYLIAIFKFDKESLDMAKTIMGNVKG